MQGEHICITEGAAHRMQRAIKGSLQQCDDSSQTPVPALDLNAGSVRRARFNLGKDFEIIWSDT